VKFSHEKPDMRLALEKEIKIIGQLMNVVGKTDPEGLSCIVRLAFFEGVTYRGRLAAVFELMKCDLREALAKYGNGRGLPLLPTVRNFSRQIFLALRALRGAGLMHCDVKPHNLLLSKDGVNIKLADFGSCHGMQQRIRSDQMMPRHYRAPEIILGQDYDFAIDVWSAGATIYQLATDTVLFKAETNNELLHEMLKVCGAFPSTFATSGQFALNHFNSDGAFLNAKGDMAINSTNPRVCPSSLFDPPQLPIPFLLEEALKEPAKGVPLSRHQGLVQHLTDLLGKCVMPNPSSRLTPHEALAYRFFQKGA